MLQRMSWPFSKILTFPTNQLRSNQLWATKRSPKTSVDSALDYFDNVYGPVFGNKWPSIRLALLCPNKYCAVVNNFSDFDGACTKLQNEGAINIRELFDLYKDSAKKSVRKRTTKQDRIYNLDDKIERIVSRTKDEEIGILYPEGTERPDIQNEISDKTKEIDEKELIKKSKTSLQQGLADASIDLSRQIDPSEGLSSSRLNEFIPVSKLKGNEGFVSESEHFAFYNEPKDFPVTIEPEGNLTFPPHLHIFAFDQGDISTFSPPKSGVTGVLDYYLMDAGSILPVLALDLRPGDTVLDMCAAPGGKSLVCLQTLYPDSLVCNDVSLSRINRVRRMLPQYIDDWKKTVTLTQTDACLIQDMDTFSKVLVDVPCTNDRLSANEVDNNIFKSSRNKERILLPQHQVDLLVHALKLVKKGGVVVYSTCALNPAQNDGVVHMALRRVWQETSMQIVVKDLNNALEPAKVVFQFADPRCLRYGSLVVPYLPANFGPMYFCKLEKIS